MAIWIKTASHVPANIYTDSESSLDTIANRRNHLNSAKTSCHILLRRIDYLLQYCPCQLLHVNSHADKHKVLADLSYSEWGNFIADKVAGDNFADLEDLSLSLVSTDIFARNVLPDIPCTNSWYWGDAAGTPLPLVPLSSQQNDVRHQLCITNRDNYRAHLPQPLPAYWYDNSLRFAAKVYELKHASPRGLSTKVRLIMSGRIKSKKASAEDQVCLLCGQDDSQAHWHHHCPHPPSAMLRSEAFKEIHEHIGASANPRYGTAFRTVLTTTPDPVRIWTSNWSLLQIQHLGALLETAQVLPQPACGLSALASEVLLLSRILSRTALQLWIVKTSIENPILRRRRIAAAEAADDAVNPTAPLPPTDVQSS